MSRPVVQLASAAALILCLWLILVALIPRDQPAVEDEVNWMAAGSVTYRLVSNRAGPAAWKTAYAGHRSFGRLNPPLGKLAIGAAVAAAKEGDAPFPYRWNFKASREENLRASNRPPPAQVHAARVAMSLFSAASLACLVVLAYQLTGALWLSLVAPVLLVSLGPFVHSATRIYTDAPQIAAMLGGMVAFQRHLTSRTWLSLCVAGVLMGLSVSVKFSSAPVIGVMGLFALSAAGTLAQRIGRAVLVGAIPVLVFVAVNPYLYPDPFGRTLEIVSRWDKLMDRVNRTPDWANDRVLSRVDGLVAVARRGMLAPNVLPRVSNAAPWLALTGLAAAGWTLLRYRVRFRGNWRDREFALGVALAAAGLAGLGFGWVGGWAWLYLFGANALAWRVARGTPDASRRLVCGFFLASLSALWVATGLWLQLDWMRYSHRVLVLTPCVLVAGLAALGERIGLERRGTPIVGVGQRDASAGRRAT